VCVREREGGGSPRGRSPSRPAPGVELAPQGVAAVHLHANSPVPLLSGRSFPPASSTSPLSLQNNAFSIDFLLTGFVRTCVCACVRARAHTHNNNFVPLPAQQSALKISQWRWIEVEFSWIWKLPKWPSQLSSVQSIGVQWYSMFNSGGKLVPVVTETIETKLLKMVCSNKKIMPFALEFMLFPYAKS
jgi:hypothetical protein